MFVDMNTLCIKKKRFNYERSKVFLISKETSPFSTGASPRAVFAMSRELHVITGGGGYVGFHLGKHLSHLGHDVLLLDLRPRPYGHLDDNMTYVRVSHVTKALFFNSEISCSLACVICKNEVA